jgi:antitoxin component YwqK of YwqJK toxin-antitoxin module
MSNESVDFHLVSLDDQDGHERVLYLKTNNEREQLKDEAMCAICFYNSEDDEDEEQEKIITKKTLYDTGRYAQMYSNVVTENNESKSECVCSHRFHTTCLYKWVKSSREFICPLCRSTPLEDQTKLSTVPELFASEPEYMVQYYPNGKVKTECYKENGLFHKFFKKYDLIGNLIYECGYFKGEKHENEIEYHTHTQKPWKIQQYRFGSKHGFYKEYSIEENSDGQQILLKHQEWQNDMLHGTEQEWFLAFQTKKRYCEFYEGAKHGVEKIWTINGKLILYKRWDHARPIGRCIVRFPENGCLERKCYYNRHGQIDGLYLEWQYACKSLTKSSTRNKTKSKGSANPLGGLMGGGGGGIIGMLTGGALNFGGGGNESEEEDEDKYNTTNVILKLKANYIDGMRVGDFVEFHDNGTVKIIAHYNMYGEYDGEYFEYDRFGRCKLRYLYDNGKLQGMCEQYTEHGKMKECGYYVDDKLDGIGAYKAFYSNGKVKEKRSYVQGLIHGDVVQYNPKGEVEERYKYRNNQMVS